MKLNVGWTKNRKVRIIAAALVLALTFWIGTRSGGVAAQGGEGHEHAAVEKEATIWTCSMHPQIRMSKPGKCPICFMDLIPLQTGSSDDEDGDAVRLTMSENAKILAGIATAPAVRRGINADIRMTGKLALDETRTEMITARIGGRIDHLYVDYTGVPVKAGDHLAQIYSPELVSLQKELLEAARAAQSVSQETTEMVRSSVARTFEAAKEKLRLLGFSERELTRVLERGSTSDHMTICAGQRGVVLRKLVEEGSYVKTGTPLFHIADLRKLWVLLDAYESDLEWLRLGQNVEFSVEAYPGRNFEGSVSFIDPVVNQMTRTVKVRVIVDNKDGRLKPDMFVKARVKASLAKSGGVKNASLRGKWISPMHPQIVKDHPGTCDICGMPLVRAEELGYVTSGFEDVEPLVVPATAVLYTGKRSVVYVELPDKERPTYEAREVELGPRVGSHYIIKSGIAEGERVVVNGNFKIDGELQIRAKPSMMSPDGGVAATGHADHGGKGATAKMNMSEPSHAPDISSKPVSKGFPGQLASVAEPYFAIAEALARDDLDGAKKELIALRKHVAAVKVEKGSQYKAWKVSAKELQDILEHAHHVAGLPDARSMFEKVSRRIITLEKHYGHAGSGSHYLAFCPMAFGKKGAYWLQTEESIQNPYFGAKMLKCGEIKETFAHK